MAVTSPLSIVARSALQLRDVGPATVNDLSRSLEISRTSVENAVTVLAESGLIVDAPAQNGGGAGRPARRYSFHGAAGTVVGVDIGVASVRVVLADLSGLVIAQRSYSGVARSPTAPPSSPL